VSDVLSYTVYKVLHLLGIMLTITALGGLALHAANGGTRAESRTRGLATAVHGTGLLLVLVAGFGMLARLGASVSSGWVLVKLVIWLVLGVAAVLPYRRPQAARLLFVAVPLLAALAGIVALTKPF
jgi:uncharacterized membrane protein SirB2